MPRVGDVYAKPSGTTAVTGQTITSAKYNELVDDIVADLNAARPVVAGGTGATSASGARTNLGLGDAATKSVTGADANVVTGTAGADGDVATWNADGDLVGSGRKATAMEFISSQDASDSSSLDFTGFDAAKYDAYVLILANIIPASSSTQLFLQTSTDGGANYDGGAAQYAWGLVYKALTTGTSTGIGAGNDAATAIGLTWTSITNAANQGVSGKITICGPHLANHTHATWELIGRDSGGLYWTLNGAGVRLSAADVDAVRIGFTSGNIASGTITMYGLRNS